MPYLSKNFHQSELECPCCKSCEMDQRFMKALQRLRDLADFPFVITSGYRCPAQNRKVKGARASRHKRGKAVDISLVGVDDMQKHKFLKHATSLDGYYTGLGLYSNHVHFDIRQRNSVWVGQ